LGAGITEAEASVATQRFLIGASMDEADVVLLVRYILGKNTALEWASEL
jgi:hypothetical protein